MVTVLLPALLHFINNQRGGMQLQKRRQILLGHFSFAGQIDLRKGPPKRGHSS